MCLGSKKRRPEIIKILYRRTKDRAIVTILKCNEKYENLNPNPTILSYF